MAMAEENEQESKCTSAISCLYFLHFWYLFIGLSKSYDGSQSHIVRTLLEEADTGMSKELGLSMQSVYLGYVTKM